MGESVKVGRSPGCIDSTRVISGLKLGARDVAEMSGVIALSTVLSFVKFFSLPEGGSVTAGSMVPILWFSLRRGAKIGCTAGAIYGLVQLMFEPYIYNPVQVLLDYPIAFGALGLAGLFKKYRVLGATVGITGRFVAHFLSGIIFFWMYAPEGMSPIVYSAIYNGGYLGVELIISAIVIHLLRIERYMVEEVVKEEKMVTEGKGVAKEGEMVVCQYCRALIKSTSIKCENCGAPRRDKYSE